MSVLGFFIVRIFSRIWTEYRDLQSKSPYPLWMWRNKGQTNPNANTSHAVDLRTLLRLYTYIHTYVYITTKNNSNSVNDKNDNSNSNELKWSYCLKEILLVVCKFCIICMDFQRVLNSLFLIWKNQDSLTGSVPYFWD